MHPFEEELANILELGDQPRPSNFGGIIELLAAANELCTSKLMPEFLRLAVEAIPSSTSHDVDLLTDFICRCIEAATDDIVLVEAVNLLGSILPLAGNGDERCFVHFLHIASDISAPPLARSIGLDGAFRLAIQNRKRQIKLLSFLLDVDTQDDANYLSHVAKICGVLHSYAPEQALLEQLEELLNVSSAKGEAAFELAMAALTKGVQTQDKQGATSAFDAAHHWFSLSQKTQEYRPDVGAYMKCLAVLSGFARGQGFTQLEDLATEIAQDAFEIAAWRRHEQDPPWFAARRVESANWNVLAFKLSALAKSLDEPSWWEPVVVVQEHVLASYAASRSVLKLSQYGGVECLIRPRIEGALAAHAGQAYILKQWLAHNAEPPWFEEAQALSRRIDEIIEGDIRNPIEAASVWQPLAAALDGSSIPSSAKQSARSVIINTFNLSLQNYSGTECQLLTRCLDAVSGSPDYRDNQTGRVLFDAVLLLTLRFLSSRLDMTQGDEQGVSYLFERDDGTMPLEEELQMDYNRFLSASNIGAQVEVRNVGGGRADVFIRFGGERLVVEVKREQTHASFDALEHAYASQTAEYQTVSIRLGFLLVLDQTQKRVTGTLHLSELVSVRRIVRPDEAEARWIVIVKVPGRRLTPSALTVEAKKNSGAATAMAAEVASQKSFTKGAQRKTRRKGGSA